MTGTIAGWRCEACGAVGGGHVVNCPVVSRPSEVDSQSSGALMALPGDQVLAARAFKRRIVNEMRSAAAGLAYFDGQVDGVAVSEVSVEERAALRGIVALLELVAQQWEPR